MKFDMYYVVGSTTGRMSQFDSGWPEDLVKIPFLAPSGMKPLVAKSLAEGGDWWGWDE